MNKYLKIIAVFLACTAGTAWAEEEMKQMKVWAMDFTDVVLARDVEAGDSCAEWLKYLQSSAERYTLSGVTGVQGPPGVVYTLDNARGHVAILKCGTTGSHGEEGGHG